MVQIEEVNERQRSQQQAQHGASDDAGWESESASDHEDFSDSDSDSDDEEVSERGLSLRQESLLDRLKALQDIVPPKYQRWISNTCSTTSSYAWFGGKLVGNLVWVVTTSALLVGLPYALASEDEAMVVRQEREFAQQQSGQQMLGGPPQGAQDPYALQQQQQSQQQAQQQGAGGIRPPGF
ncbi:unnamed protein product [Sympodiomycopsis kandeliae]